MRAIETSIALVATLAALQACSHLAVTRPAAPAAAAGVVRAASDEEEEHATRLIFAKFEEEGGEVDDVEVQDIYEYVCRYSRVEDGRLCLYSAKGQVDLDAWEVAVTSRKRESCHPIDARTR